MSSENQNSQPEEIELGVLFQKINNFFAIQDFRIPPSHDSNRRRNTRWVKKKKDMSIKTMQC